MAEKKEIDPSELKDLIPQNRRKRKEPQKPWGKKERLFVGIIFLSTILTASAMSLSARSWKLPGLPSLKTTFSLKGLFEEKTVVVGNLGSSVDQVKIEEIKKSFIDKTNKYSGIYCFYIYDLNGNYFYGENHKEIMQAASLIKLPVMAGLFLEGERGNLDSKDYLPLIEAMGKRSDNNAFLQAVSMLGKDKVEQIIADLGMSHTSYKENQTTAEDVGMFFKKLYNNEILNEDDTNYFLEMITDTIFEDWLVAGIPDDIRVAHKYGREVHVVNDGGIVFATHPFIMVIMSDGVVENEADAIFPDLSRVLFYGQTNEKPN